MTPAGDRIDWRRASRGLFWIGIGALLLANTTGVVSWSVWIEALPYWPLLLVSAGIRLIFERSRLPGLVLLSPLLLLCTLGWVVLSDARGPSAQDWTSVQAEHGPEAQEWSLEGELVFADLEIRAAPLSDSLLVQGRSAPERAGSLQVRGAGDRPRVRIGREPRDFRALAPSERGHWELTIADSPPLSLDLVLAFSKGTLDLVEAPLDRVDLQGAFNSMTLRLGEIADEQDVQIRLEGAFNDLSIVAPPTTPVAIETDGFLTRGSGRPRDAAATGPGYQVHVDGAFSAVHVRAD